MDSRNLRRWRLYLPDVRAFSSFLQFNRNFSIPVFNNDLSFIQRLEMVLLHSNSDSVRLRDNEAIVQEGGSFRLLRRIHMIYEAVIGTGTIIFLLLVWTLLMHPFSEIKARIYNATPSSVFNESVNKTVIKSNYEQYISPLGLLLFIKRTKVLSFIILNFISTG